jgi:uncharacterized protein (TIGR01244 family)
VIVFRNAKGILLALSIVALALVGCAGAEEAIEPEEVKAMAKEPPDPATLLLNGMLPFEGILIGGQPTLAQLAAIHDQGYKTVINMRQPEEAGSTRPEDVEALGMAYVPLPINGAEGVNEENARRLAEVLEEAGRPVVVHCGSGNRVGALFAMKAFLLDGEAAEKALAIGKAAGLTRLEPVVREKLGLAEEAEKDPSD